MKSSESYTRYELGRDEARKGQIIAMRQELMDNLDPSEALTMSNSELEFSIFQALSQIAVNNKVTMNLREQQQLTKELLDDIRGLGPLEALINDDTVSDILVNGPHQVYVEQNGHLTLADVSFRDQSHVHNIAQRVASRVGRRIDESSPMVDARLEDGSRVNVVAPPLSLNGTVISIRKFSKHKLTLSHMATANNLSKSMADLLALFVKAKMNILVSGGTGAGKTTLLNALSAHIGDDERVITIEDAAELQLNQPHVVSLETRATSIEGSGEVNQTDLVKNALRMRPDRILLGEVRGEEVFDMLQAMNTGHDGSLSTVHANTPNDALIRLENMLSMAQSKLSPELIRKQIASSIDVIVQIERCRDGHRRVTKISETHGVNSGQIELTTLFEFEIHESDNEDTLQGAFVQRQTSSEKQEKLISAGLSRQLKQLLGGRG
ncbi:CpaF family protein [Vibrio sp. 10N.261.55.A7]|uniref:CpaF family protein n=1 Tax=Vibrio sp. 10N.261.55.A7 TaxID=1880851 RepID=UPI000C847EDC|nr:CpaF family protein [Vibrio sp. 10N.261.55.A7]PMJ96403.1 pilus assembly protein CpaF [Vibrio sp. 10N.261.55.A7]